MLWRCLGAKTYISIEESHTSTKRSLTLYNSQKATMGFTLKDSAALGRKWIADCLATHTSCAKKARHANIFCTDNAHFISDLKADRLVPTRLLSFSLSETDTVVRLTPSSSLDSETKYVAMSHQWGKARIFRTLKENADAFFGKGIDEGELPRTFRDAVHVTRSLGYIISGLIHCV